MKPSSIQDVREMYEFSADSYSEMMDLEIKLPVYADVLDRMQERILDIEGLLIDSACGSGHMLSMFHDRCDQKRPLLGVDLSPRMITISRTRLGWNAQLTVGDMRHLSEVESESAAGVINFFAVHHLGPEDVRMAFAEWFRTLRSGGQLLVAAWEGEGEIDYGEESTIVAFRYSSEDLSTWAKTVGFTVLRCAVERVEEFPMNAIYLECMKE